MKNEINIITDNDKCWLLNTIVKLVPLLEKNGFNIKSIWVLPDKLSYLKSYNIPFWYLKIFGLINFIKLVIFYLIVIIKNLQRNIKNFKYFDLKKNIKTNYITNIEDENLYRMLKNDKQKYNLIFTNHIIPKKLLKLKNNNFINKHASLLPSFRGLLPFIWTKILNSSNGISIHLVSEEIDNGKILFQKKYNKNYSSMINFYLDIFWDTPKYILKSIQNLESKNFYAPKYKSSTFSLPNKKDFKRFKECGGKVINLDDFKFINKIVGKI